MKYSISTDTYITISDRDAQRDVFQTIEKFGNGLSGIVLILNFPINELSLDKFPPTEYINSPELKILTIGANLLDDPLSSYLPVYEYNHATFVLELLSQRCKKLENLKIIRGAITQHEDHIKKTFSNCNVEFEDCTFTCEICDEWPEECAKEECSMDEYWWWMTGAGAAKRDVPLLRLKKFLKN